MTANKKSQISVEFIIIFSLVIFALIGFIYIMNIRLSDISERQELLLMRNLANNIKEEVIIASSVNNNYLRRFNIPTKIKGKDYNMSIENDELIIKLIENNQVVKEYFTVFPVPVKGSFVEDINYENTDHCITKNDFDGIRIARNQLSLDTNSTRFSPGDVFNVLVSLNCVEDIRSVQFTIKYDPNKTRLIRNTVEPVTRHNYPNFNPLFSDVLSITPYAGKISQLIGLKFVDDTNGRFTYGYIARECASGSGNIAKMSFEVLPTAAGRATIEFDPDFKERNLIVLDCYTNAETRESVPNSRKNLNLQII